MASRAEPAGVRGVPGVRGRSAADSARSARLPGLRSALRASLSDYYFNSIRLVAANLAWGVTVVVLVLVGLVSPLLALFMAPFLAIPTAVVFRLAGAIVRGQSTTGRRVLLPGSPGQVAREVALGLAFVMAAVVFGANLMIGLGSGEPVGVVVATLAGWGLVGLWALAVVMWPLLGDPSRAGTSFRARLSLAGTLLLVGPARVAALAGSAFVLTALSVVLTAALLTVSLSFVALVACRVVYPAADRLEAEFGPSGS